MVMAPIFAAFAQTATTETGAAAQQSPPPPNWTIACTADGAEAPLRCRMVQEVYMASSKQKVLTLTVNGPANPGEPATMTLALPHGIHLPAGAVLKVDEGEALKLDFQTSDQAGVYAGTTLAQPLLDTVKRGNAMTVTISDASGKALAIPVNLTGFTAALNRYLNPK